MEGNYYKEWSAALGREMEFKVYGSGGVPVLAFPCRGGRFYDWEDHGMPEAAGWLIQNGRVQLFCADSVDLDGADSPGQAAALQEKYFNYITGELVPRILALNAASPAAPATDDAPSGAEKADKPARKPRIWCIGAGAGAWQAVNCRLRRPGLFCGAIGLSGFYDPAALQGADDDGLALRNRPLAALAVGLPDSAARAALQDGQFILCAGQSSAQPEPAALASTQALDAALKAAGIPVQTEAWGQDVNHDWYWWARAWDVFSNRLFS